jgi:hypothetical protein
VALHVGLSELHGVLILVVAASPAPVRPIFRMSLYHEALLFVVLCHGIASAVVCGSLTLAPTIRRRPDLGVVQLLNIVTTATLVHVLQIDR